MIARDCPLLSVTTRQVLAWDDEFRTVLQEYASDEALLRHEFGEAFKRLTELGCTNLGPTS